MANQDDVVNDGKEMIKEDNGSNESDTKEVPNDGNVKEGSSTIYKEDEEEACYQNSLHLCMGYDRQATL